MKQLMIIERLKEDQDGILNTEYSEGYLEGLVNFGVITEDEYENLMKIILKKARI